MKFPVEKSVLLRCYGNLNDFLPVINRGQTFLFRYSGFPTIKDLLEGIGIPHVEIGAVFYNDIFSNWNTVIESQSRLSVFPHFVNIIEVPKLLNPVYPNAEMKFIADTHLGKLARMLRMIGFDTLYDTNYVDQEIIDVSNSEGRAILTRDKGILFHGSANWGYFLRSQDPGIQLHEVLKTFGLPKFSKPLSRCMLCNGLIEEVSKSFVKHLVEQSIIDFNKSFFRCNSCGKIYWQGTHYLKLKLLVEKLENRYG